MSKPSKRKINQQLRKVANIEELKGNRERARQLYLEAGYTQAELDFMEFGDEDEEQKACLNR